MSQHLKILPFSLFLLCFILSCQSSNKEVEDNVLDIEIEPPSTSYKYPKLELPENFKIVHISINDTLTNRYYEMSCLQSTLPKMNRFNKAIRTALMNYITEQSLYLEPPIYGVFMNDNLKAGFELELRPIDIFITKNIISVTHIENSYFEGGNHHNHGWFSFNYDLKTNKPITFDEVFDIQTSLDSTNFIDYVAENQEYDCLHWYKPYENMDFSFSKKGIYINPALSWACSLNRSLLPKEDLQFLHLNWKRKLERRD